MIKRIIIGILYIFSAFVFPWWLVLIFGIALSIYFQNFFEFLIAMVIIDSLYGGIHQFVGIEFVFSIFALIFLVVTKKIKENVRV